METIALHSLKKCGAKKKTTRKKLLHHLLLSMHWHAKLNWSNKKNKYLQWATRNHRCNILITLSISTVQTWKWNNSSHFVKCGDFSISFSKASNVHIFYWRAITYMLIQLGNQRVKKLGDHFLFWHVTNFKIKWKSNKKNTLEK